MATVTLCDDHGNTKEVEVCDIRATDVIADHMEECPVCNKLALRGKKRCKSLIEKNLGIVGKDTDCLAYLALIREYGEIRLVLCDAEGERYPSGYLLGFTKDGTLQPFSGVTQKAVECGLELTSHGSLVVEEE